MWTWHVTGTVSRHELSHFHHASSLSKTPITGRCCYLMSMIDPWSYWTRFRVSPSRRVISPLHPTEYVDLKLFLLILTLIEGKQMAFCIVRFLPLHEQLLCPQPLLSQPRVPQYFLLANLATSPNYQLKHLMQILFHNCFTQEHFFVGIEFSTLNNCVGPLIVVGNVPNSIKTLS